MKGFRLQAPIKEQLRAILHDYPGGQLLSEALQNAEDSGATTFVLTLDRRRPTAFTDPKLAGPGFVLADDGRGFGDTEWTSLQNLHQSEKANSPRDIGRFGMGSRSYFHYSDVSLVVSNGQYCGIDPLLTVKANGREELSGGWRCPVTDSDLGDEVATLFNALSLRSGKGTGAMFRLPIRQTQDDKDGGLGPAITPADADHLLAEWARSLCDGRLLLFVASVRTVTVQRWDDGAAAPTILAQVTKTVASGEAFSRLPSALPRESTETFEALQSYLLSLAPHDRELLAQEHTSTTEIKVSGARVPSSSATWRVVQRFAANVEELVQSIEMCRATPTVGVAFPLANYGKADSELIPHAEGAAFCFLPIGALRTGLPVHLNASFHVTKDRRTLWGTGDNLQGQHAAWAMWNFCLLDTVLPCLWRDGLLGLITDASSDQTARVLSCFPDLESVGRVGGLMWSVCAEAMYRVIHDAPVLPHLSQSKVRWVPPRMSQVLEDPGKSNFTTQLREELMAVHEAWWIDDDCNIIDVPSHVSSACRTHSGLTDVTTDYFLQRMLRAVGPAQPVHQLTPFLIALAKQLDKSDPTNSGEKWRELLAKHAWVPLKGQTRYAKVADAFTPSKDAVIHREDFDVVSTATADENCPSALRTMTMWGLKSQLTWHDAFLEAEGVARAKDLVRAQKFVQYLESNVKAFTGHVIADTFDLSIFPAVFGSEPKPTRLCRAADLCEPRAHAVSWAVLGTSYANLICLQEIGLKWRPLTFDDIVEQVNKLVQFAEQGELTQAGVEPHLKKVAEFLSQKDNARSTFCQLQRVAWIPSSCPRDNSAIRLMRPTEVALEWRHDLKPAFGLVIDTWRMLNTSPCWTAIGIQNTIPATSLLDALQQMATTRPLSEADLKLAVQLTQELADRDKPNHELRKLLRSGIKCFVPTTCGQLVDATRVFINDAPWSKSNPEKALLLHNDVPPAVGDTLGCTSVRDELARTCEAEDDLSESFGQYEDLGTRIAGLLREYYSETDVFAEHWQNSDDAGANSVLFMLDLRTYRTEKLVSPKFSRLQGPALVLASSKALSAKDIERIQKLGNSDKQLQFGQIGRFGVGLACMYGPADCPMLLANNALHVMDPLGQVVHEENKRGKKWAVQKLRENEFVDMLMPFDTEQDEYPTIFRLPLRDQGSKFGKPIKLERIQVALEEFASRAENLLIFAKNVRRATFAVRDAHGKVMEIAMVERRISSTDPQRVMERLPKTLSDTRSFADSPLQQVETVVIDTRGKRDGESLWIVVHALVSNPELLRLADSLHQTGVALIPHGAAALRLSGRGKYRGSVCCYLPLTGTVVKAPLLLHGCFALSANRKAIPIGDDKASNTKWNRELLSGPVAAALSSLVLETRRNMNEGTLSWNDWESLLQFDIDGIETVFRELLRKSVVSRLHQEEVFAVTIMNNDGTGTRPQEFVRWAKGTEVFLPPPNTELGYEVQNCLVHAGLNLVSTPEALREDLAPLSPTHLSTFLKSLGLATVRKWGNTSSTVISLVKFVLMGYQKTTAMLGIYHQKGNEGENLASALITALNDTPLLLLENETLTRFGKGMTYWNNSDLIPSRNDLFVHRSLRSAICALSTRSAVEQAVQKIDLQRFTLKSLLAHCDDIHEETLHNDIWRTSAFALIAQTAATNRDNGQSVISDLAEWRLVNVIPPPNSDISSLIPVKQLSSVFSLEDTDKEFHKKLIIVLHEMGFPVLNPEDAPQREMFGQRALHGNSALFQSLIGKELTESSVQIVFEYLCLASFKRTLMRSDLQTVSRLKIFRSLSGTLLPLGQGTETNVVVQNQSCLSRELATVLKVHFLTKPPSGSDRLYSQLGVIALSDREFVLRFVCKALRDVAADASAVVGSRKQAENRELALLLDTLTDWVWDPAVKEASRDLQFVKTKGNRLLPPKSVIHPDSPLASAFPDVTADYTPTESWNKRINLLEALGMTRTATNELVLKCAVALDKVSRRPETKRNEVHKQSGILVREVIQRIPNRDDLPAMLKAAEYNIALALPSGREMLFSQLSSQLSGVSHPEAKLRPFRDLIVSDVCAKMASRTYATLHAQEECLPPHRGHPAFAVLHEHFGCLTEAHHVPLPALLSQFREMVSIFKEMGPRAASKTCFKIEEVLHQIERTLPKDITQSEYPQLGVLETSECIPVRPQRDAAGPPELAMGWLEFVKPGLCFAQLPRERVSELPLREVSSFFDQFPQLSKLLGVRSTPLPSDWVRCTQIVQKRADGKKATPNDVQAVRLAIRCVLESRSEPSSCHGLCLIDDGGMCTLAADLTWADRPDLQSRCDGALFAHDADNGTIHPNQWLELCKLTGLRQLSKSVCEVLSEPFPEVEPAQDEACLSELLQSAEFANGVTTLFVNEMNQKDQAMKIRVRQKLAAFRIVWVDRLTTTLQSVGEKGKNECGSTDKLAFFDGAHNLWIKSKQLSNPESRDMLLEEIGGSVIPSMLHTDGGINKTHIIIAMLRRFNTDGPSGIQSVLDSQGVARMGSGVLERTQPGTPVPRSEHDDLLWDPSFTFQPGETIAVPVLGVHETYIYAKIATDQLSAASSQQPRTDGRLSRLYSVNEGGQESTVRKHLELYRITRQLPTQGGNEVAGAIVVDGNATAPTLLGTVETEILRDGVPTAEWVELMKIFQEMIHLSPEEYRQVIKQLWRQWHPDKNKSDVASTMFQLIQRHGECYERKGDWSWLDKLTPQTASAAAGDGVPVEGNSSARFHGAPGAAEFEPQWQSAYYEDFQRDEVTRHAARQRQHTAKTAWQRQDCGEPRIKDEKMADRFFQLARREQDVTVLMQRGDLWATSVWHSHQAAEFAIKALMLYTCGITAAELKGKGAHDLVELLQRLRPDRTEWPAAPDTVATLTEGYIGTRYGPRALEYTQEDAVSAQITSSAIVTWTQDTDRVHVLPK
eukprot:m.271728 g.271728  ORF g.271728 m.271728 type:complete len:2925 (+) comp16103_c1_seq1:130-8904(+)